MEYKEKKASLPSLISVIISIIGFIILLGSLTACYQNYGWKSIWFYTNSIGFIIVYLFLITLFAVSMTNIFTELAPQLVKSEDVAYDENKVRSNRIRNKNFYDSISDYLSNYPSIFYFVLTIFLVIVFVQVDKKYLNDKFQYYDLLVEAHGLIFDAIIFGFLLSFYEKFRSKKEEVNRNLERIEDFSGGKNLEAKQKITMSLHRLSKYQIRHINLKKAYLKNAELYNIYLSESIILNTDLENSEIEGSNFDNCYLINSNLRKTSCKNSNIREAIFYNTNLNESNLEKVNLSNTILIESKLGFKSIINTNFDNVITDNKMIFDNLLSSSCVGADAISNKYELSKYDIIELKKRMNKAFDWIKKDAISIDLREKIMNTLDNENIEFYEIKKKF